MKNYLHYPTLLLALSTTFAQTVEQAPTPPEIITNEPPVIKFVAAAKQPQKASQAIIPQASPISAAAVSQLLEDAENGTAQIVIDDAGGAMSVIQDNVVFEGDFSFQLANPNADDTSIEITTPIAVQNDTKLIFASKYGLMASGQAAKVQLSTDGGSSYSDTLWNRIGTGSAGGAFESVELELSAYAGQEVMIRFILDFNFGSYYDGSSSAVGWFIDYISIGSDSAKPIYSIGEPTDLEQYNLELINRSRADALAEADRLIALASPGGDPDVINAVNFYSITPADIRAQYEWAIDNGHMAASAQPLAFNAKLIEAARLHTQDMFDNAFQEHTSSDTPPAEANYPAGASLAQRVTASGYQYYNLGESIFAYAKSIQHAHAGFLIDWGNTSNPGDSRYNPAFIGQGMQNPAGHRLSNHNAIFKEVGIGIIEGTNGSVGPQIITQDFASPQAGDQFITGVIIADMDGDDFFDPGEGIGNVIITALPANGSTATPAYQAVSSTSGGYALPVPGNGDYTLTFSHSAYGTAQTTCTLSGGENFKVDWIPQIMEVLSFGDSQSLPNTLELTFFDAGIEGTPRLETTDNLGNGFTVENTATLSGRNEEGYRTFQYSKPAALQYFSRVIIE